MMQLLFVGRPSIHKGVSVLIQALYLVRSIDWKLSIVGELAQEDEIVVTTAIAQGMNIETYGACDSNIVSMHMRASDILIVPSLYENFGNVALEGMACGCVIIASRTGGLVDFVSEGRNGWLVKVGEPLDISIALDICMSQPNWLMKAKRESILMAQNYSWQIVSEATLSLFKSLQITQ